MEYITENVSYCRKIPVSREQRGVMLSLVLRHMNNKLLKTLPMVISILHYCSKYFIRKIKKFSSYETNILLFSIATDDFKKCSMYLICRANERKYELDAESRSILYDMGFKSKLKEL